MTQPIYKMYWAKFSDTWYQLPDDEQATLLAQMRQLRDEVGAKRVMSCNCRWSSEAWDMFGIEEYPGLEAVQSYAKALQEIGWFRYIEGDSMLGTDWHTT